MRTQTNQKHFSTFQGNRSTLLLKLIEERNTHEEETEQIKRNPDFGKKGPVQTAKTAEIREPQMAGKDEGLHWQERQTDQYAAVISWQRAVEVLIRASSYLPPFLVDPYGPLNHCLLLPENSSEKAVP